MLQPIFADCILHGRGKSTAAKKRERKIRKIKGHTSGGGIRDGGREMPINELCKRKDPA